MPETPPNIPPDSHQNLALPLAARIALAQKYGHAETVPGESKIPPENKDHQVQNTKEKGLGENGASPLPKKTTQDSDDSHGKP